jgi:hypothetical protein
MSTFWAGKSGTAWSMISARNRVKYRHPSGQTFSDLEVCEVGMNEQSFQKLAGVAAADFISIKQGEWR